MVSFIHRRVAGRIIFLALLLFAGCHAFAQRQVSGRITDTYEKGVGGVVVSDGFNVYKSDPKGCFSFETHPRARFVYISTPGGYEQVGDFFVRLGDKLPAIIDFKLKKVDDQPSAFIHIGDPEASTYKDWIDGLKDYIANHKIAFLLMNGDICYEKGQDFHSREINRNTMGVRVVYSLGNHDLIAGDYGEQHFEQHFGPVWYSFNVGGVHFVITPVIYGDKVPSYSADDLYRWLRKDLDAIPKGTPVILANHHLYDLDTFNLKGYLYAHYHTNLFKYTDKGCYTFSSMSPNKGGIDHSPSSFRVLSFDKTGELRSRIKYSCLDNHIVANSFHSCAGSGHGFTVLANIYDTGSEVDCAVVLAGKKEFRMQQKSSWNWVCNLPENVSETASLRVRIGFSDGSVVYKQVIKENCSKESPQIKWVSNIGGNIFMVSPLIAGNLVISATIDDDSAEKSSIGALDKSTGKVLWSFKTRNSVKNNMALWGDTVLACDVEGRLYALEAATGKVVWYKDLRSKGTHPVFTEGVTVNDGIVYAGQGSSLTAVRISDGGILWTNNAWKSGVSTVASPVVEPKSKVLLSGGYWLGRFAHDAVSGKLLWEKRDEDSRICDNTPVAYGGHFFYTSPGYITEVDPITGAELLKLKIGQTVNVNSRPVVTERYYVVGTSDKGVAAFDRQNGYKELWNYRTNPSLFYTAPYTKDFQMTVEGGVCLNDNNLYFGANDGCLYCLDVRNGLFKWRMNLGAPILGNIVVEGNFLYVNDFGGNTWCITIPVN